MDMPQALVKEWGHRAVTDHGPVSEHDAYYGPLIFDDLGGECDPETARRIAFELLVFADLAPLAPEPTS